MSLENGMTPADLAAVFRGNGNGWGFGGGDSGAWWIIILFLFAMMGGGGWNGYGNANAAVPYIGATADIQRGFDQQSTSAGIANLQAQVGNGFADAAVARCSGNANVTQAITNAQYATSQAVGGAKDTIALGLNQLALAAQQGFNDNRAGQADLKYTIATENCQDRQALSDGLRDLMAQNTANTNLIVQSQNQGFQAIQDKLCQLEIEGLKQTNEQLRSQLNMAALAASQTAQTATIVGQLKPPAPIPAYTVPNPFAPTTTT